MNRWAILVIMAIAVGVILFFYTPVGLIVSMLAAGVVSLAVGRLQDPVLWFFGMFLLAVIITSILFWLKLRRKNGYG